jgi:hypothetical protein
VDQTVPKVSQTLPKSNEAVAESGFITFDAHDKDPEVIVVLRVAGSPHLLSSLVHTLDRVEV